MTNDVQFPENEAANAMRTLTYLYVIRWQGIPKDEAVVLAAKFACRRPDLTLTAGTLDRLIGAVYGKA